jgi:hypothetical protein
MYLPSYPLSVLKGKVLYHMLAEDTFKGLVWEREGSAEVNQIMHVLISKPVDIHPAGIVNAPRPRTKIQE